MLNLGGGILLQVHYSLIYRLPEENNVKKTCDELGVSLIAYSPLGQGAYYSTSFPLNLQIPAKQLYSVVKK